MNINNIGTYPAQSPAQTDPVSQSEQGSNSDMEQQIKTLDKEKGKLEGQLDKERNPFALQQSEKYKELEKRIKELDKQIQQLKAEASSAQKKAGIQNKEAVSSRNPFDTYESEKQGFND
ncbi:FlxA-like family protein [Lacrimispora sp.]|uniref:FlxA-like family protein n=1 Tax=Lacrimispora sp. TaxID=2719234 RepID=UPI0032E43A13